VSKHRDFIFEIRILSKNTCAVTLAAHVFFDKIGKIHENTGKNEKNVTLRYLLVVVVIKYSLLNPRWRKPEVEVIQNWQLYMNSIL